MTKYRTPLQRRKAAAEKRRWPFVIIVILVIGALVSLCLMVGYQYLKDSNVGHSTMSDKTASDKGETQSKPSSSAVPNTTTNGASDSSPNKEGDAASSNPPSTASLAEPSGTFISNHAPSLSNSPSIQSSCNTTPGAKCNITLTSGNVTKSLGERTSDADGAVYWGWTLQDKGITEGSWKIKAISVLGNQTKITNDPINLEVKP